MPDSVVVTDAVAIRLAFPRSAYSGAGLGRTESLPDHARVHEAFVAAAAGGPAARADGNVLVAIDEHLRAVKWLEENEPIGLVAPEAWQTSYSPRRYRWRASPVVSNDTDFEPFSALSAPVVYLWPPAADAVVGALAQIAAEVTHVGRADSIVVADVYRTDVSTCEVGLQLRADGRGPGHIMRIARPGRFATLAQAHARACQPGRHDVGSLGKQAADEQVTCCNDEALDLRRFAPSGLDVDWPFDQVLELAVNDATAVGEWLRRPANRVAAAVGIHRALIERIGQSVPTFITGRDGDGPLRGSGHLAIHITDEGDCALRVYLAIPKGVADADREQLFGAVLASPLRARAILGRGRARRFTVKPQFEQRSAVPFWPNKAGLMKTTVPLAIDINGGPRRGSWTLDDAVVCSVGFAMRGILEARGVAWAAGWAFRTELVRRLREEFGVDARANRVLGNALRYVHRAGGNELVVAADAHVRLGDLTPPAGAGFLALGRARHLGGGLLAPAESIQ